MNGRLDVVLTFNNVPPEEVDALVSFAKEYFPIIDYVKIEMYNIKED